MARMRTRAEQASSCQSRATNVGGVRRAASPIEEFLSSQDPVWVWDGENGRIAWANAAGTAFWGEKNFECLRTRRFDATNGRKAHGVARMDALARNRSAKSQWIETLTLPTEGGEQGGLCCLQRLQLAGGERGVIVRVLIDGDSVPGGNCVAALSDRRAEEQPARAGKVVARREDDKLPAEFSGAAAAPLRAMSDALGGYVLLDAKGLIVFASKQARRLLDCENADLAGKALSGLFLGAQKQIERSVMRACAVAASGKPGGACRPSRLEGVLLGARQEPAPCRVLLIPIHECSGVCVSLCDLRQGKALQRRLDARRKKTVGE